MGMDDTEQINSSDQEALGRKQTAAKEESICTDVEISNEDPMRQWHRRLFERQALHEIIPMVQSLQMNELPMFTMPQLLQACSEVIEQICSVATDEATLTNASPDLMDRFSLGYECHIEQDALLGYLRLFAEEKVGFICEPFSDGTWSLMKASILPQGQG